MLPKVELAKSRDFGEIINDAFTFLKQNFKPLLKAYFVFCGIFLLATIVLQNLQLIKTYDLQQRVLNDPASINNSFNTFSRFGIEYFLHMLFILLNYTTATVTVLCYMSLYKEKGNIPPTLEELWAYIKYFYLRVIGATFLLSILLMAGFVFCLVPGFYLYPIFGLVFPIMVFENTSFSYAFNRSFSLIRDNWWATFGALIVIAIIVYIGIVIFSVPVIILSAISYVLHYSTGGLFLPISIFTTIIQGIGQVLMIIPIIGLALCYFNLNERKEGTGLIDRINSFGKPTDNNFPAEEY